MPRPSAQKGVRANTKEAFKAAFTEAYETADGPVVIDCKINEDELVLPMLPRRQHGRPYHRKGGGPVKKYVIAVYVDNKFGVLDKGH